MFCTNDTIEKEVSAYKVTTHHWFEKAKACKQVDKFLTDPWFDDSLSVVKGSYLHVSIHNLTSK